jgi:5'-3' exonuclease
MSENSKNTFLLVDLANLFFRAKFIAMKKDDPWEKVGTSLDTTFMALMTCVKKWPESHIVFALESRSWRKQFTTTGKTGLSVGYKENREVILTENEEEESKLFWATFDELVNYLNERTNCSVLKVQGAEADDIIARWIHLHPNDHHVILSTDSDFYQLIAENVDCYNGIQNHLITLKGVWDHKNKVVLDSKTNLPKGIGDPEWLLFEKCIRGDSSDNIMSAFPGARRKSTKKKIGLEEAFNDRHKKGFAWNSVMNTVWVDHEGVDHKVLDDYLRNLSLIDLTAQPQEIKDRIDEQILTLEPKAVTLIGARFMKFCSKYTLVRLEKNTTFFADVLSKSYTKQRDSFDAD